MGRSQEGPNITSAPGYTIVRCVFTTMTNSAKRLIGLSIYDNLAKCGHRGDGKDDPSQLILENVCGLSGSSAPRLLQDGHRGQKSIRGEHWLAKWTRGAAADRTSLTKYPLAGNTEILGEQRLLARFQSGFLIAGRIRLRCALVAGRFDNHEREPTRVRHRGIGRVQVPRGNCRWRTRRSFLGMAPSG